ncbi:SusC/RagA family TonB-linked outer membrane protein [Haliscomenobacter hydrossis]|uniref:TonB-dependent receptor plug n=1 Tax=Haliscomenobacter hydrossis (strain ATCC 27775 / DSM 1100 / LMG 10767 / O) TaxID=760192 RepID=F4KT97_HALH1|nr:SusC/RagA family TonB-linked outer membrane protein [Haliscomenobacter hydrossis]AEE51154.1 TonB-dependent receptor plug [Haliscomenobacter hydrossis DSM 1100]
MRRILLRLILLVLVLMAQQAYAQHKTLSGTVTDETGKPMEFVTVLVKGSDIGMSTGADGGFSLNAPTTATVLVFSFVGYKTLEINAESATPINVRMELAGNLDEVVVVGYGKQSRRTLSGSVSTVGAEALKSAPRTNVGTVLQGTVTGLRVQQNTGQPGATPTISFRGGTNFNGSGSPLIVLDGVIVPSLYGINMADVETIDLLKDAASTAIYGARASNGVVLITTKKGKKGRTQVNYSYKNATNYVRRSPIDYMSARDYILWNRRGIGSRYELGKAGRDGDTTSTKNQLTGAWGWGVNSGWTAANGRYSTQLVSGSNRQLLSNPEWSLLVDKNPFNPNKIDSILFRSVSQQELEDLILQQSKLEDHYINFSGANDMGSFALGLGALQDVGMVVGSSLKRLSFNFNGGLNVNKDLKISLNASGYSDKNTPSYLTADGGGGVGGGLMQRFVGIAPTVRLSHDITGEILPGVDGGTLGNPEYLQDKFINRNEEQRFSGGINLEYSILPSLKFLASGSGFMRYSTAESFTKQFQNGTGGAINSTRASSFGNQRVYQYTYNGFLQYDKTFDKHALSVLGGGEFYDFKTYDYSAAANGAATDFITYLNAASTAVGVPSSSFSSWNRLASAIGRINYDFDTRFLATVNLRYDGTSKLTENRYGIFPGVSLGWNLHRENFFTQSGLDKYIRTLKPRISWGENGSLDPLGDFATTAVYGNVGTYAGNPGFASGALFNTALKWERANTLNFGLDLGLFDNRITVIADYFIRNVYDKIAGLSIPAWTGYSSFTTNLGQLQNKGIELELRAQVIRPDKPGGLSIELGANMFQVKNFVVDLPNNGLERNRQSTIRVWDPAQGKIVQVSGLQEGLRVGLDEIWAPTYNGIYTSQGDLDARASFFNSFLPSPNKRAKILGDARWNDVDVNDTLDFRDFTFVGRSTPSIQGGFNTVINWKGFSLYGQFDYSLGFVILNQAYLRGMSQVQGSQNGPIDVTNTWHPDNPTGTLPRYYWANYGRNYFTDAGGGTSQTNPAPGNFYQKGDYVAIREITLSYELPSSFLENTLKNKIRGLRVYASGSNLAYLSRYKGTFPEVGGNDVGRFPLPRVATLGVNLSL